MKKKKKKCTTTVWTFLWCFKYFCEGYTEYYFKNFCVCTHEKLKLMERVMKSFLKKLLEYENLNSMALLAKKCFWKNT